MWAPAGRRTLVSFTPPSASQWRVWSVSVVFSYHLERANNILHSPVFTLKYEISRVLKSQPDAHDFNTNTTLVSCCTCMVLLLVRVITKFFHSQCWSTTWAKMTCPLPQAPASWVPSADQARLNTLPVLGFSSAYDHWGWGDEREQQLMDADIYRQL